MARPWITNPLLWCLAAALAQFLFYGSDSVWWGGHTYGPRYMLDVLPLLVPLAIEGATRVRTPALRSLTAAVLTWSAITAAPAFVYPHERWNGTPLDVDRHHERLWDWSDPQILRCWRSGLRRPPIPT